MEEAEEGGGRDDRDRYFTCCRRFERPDGRGGEGCGAFRDRAQYKSGVTVNSRRKMGHEDWKVAETQSIIATGVLANVSEFLDETRRINYLTRLYTYQ